MPPVISLIACIIVVIWLLRIERKQNPEPSLALWIPTLWLLIMGSRAVGSWFTTTTAVSEAEGSVHDRVVLSILMLLALWAISKKKIEWSRVLKDNLWLILLYLYLLSSILWSDAPYTSLKRWFRVYGTVLAALVILCEWQPLQALETIIRRCSYILIPFSLILVRYYDQWGRAYDRWSGMTSWIGVTTQKNSLGILCAMSAFFLIRSVFLKWRAAELRKIKALIFADMLVIGIALFLLKGPGNSYSATSITLLFVGTTTFFLLFRYQSLARSLANHLKAIMITMILIFLLCSTILVSTFSSLLGRNESLTGRTDIWKSVLQVAERNPIWGTGYGGYWGVQESSYLMHYGVHQSHNGYLEVYLQIGIVGIVVLFAFILEFCGKVRRELNGGFDWNVVGICFLMMLLLLNYSEASFISTNYIWTTTVFLTVTFSAPVYIQTKNELNL